jgi:mono/diheme cytochrome c family protein
MTEEVRRIEQVRQSELRKAAAMTADLTGEQVFIRSCNTCHPSGRKGYGPALDKVAEHFPDDKKLKELIRAGKGLMPAQPKSSLNDQELENVVAYLRQLKVRK